LNTYQAIETEVNRQEFFDIDALKKIPVFPPFLNFSARVQDIAVFNLPEILEYTYPTRKWNSDGEFIISDAVRVDGWRGIYLDAEAGEWGALHILYARELGISPASAAVGLLELMAYKFGDSEAREMIADLETYRTYIVERDETAVMLARGELIPVGENNE